MKWEKLVMRPPIRPGANPKRLAQERPKKAVAPSCGDVYRVHLRDGDRITYACVRRVGHTGDHWVRGFGGRILKRWPL